MKSMQGLLHKTTLQLAQERKDNYTTFQTTSIAGQKRTLSDGAGQLGQPASASDGTVRFQRASTLPASGKKLSASSIVNVGAQGGTSEYSQRLQFAATPTVNHDPELDLAHPTYGLPEQLVQNFASLGIKQIYPWQKNCLKGPGLLKGDKNLVYCAPTGGGKSLVADCEMPRDQSFGQGADFPSAYAKKST